MLRIYASSNFQYSLITRYFQENELHSTSFLVFLVLPFFNIIYFVIHNLSLSLLLPQLSLMCFILLEYFFHLIFIPCLLFLVQPWSSKLSHFHNSLSQIISVAPFSHPFDPCNSHCFTEQKALKRSTLLLLPFKRNQEGRFRKVFSPWSSKFMEQTIKSYKI